MRLLSGKTTPGAESDPDIKLLGGMDAIEPYMGRVWAGQALLHAWHHKAVDAVQTALTDDEWQVREIAAELVGHQELTMVDELVQLLINDADPQGRVAAANAIDAPAHPHDDVAIGSLKRHDR